MIDVVKLARIRSYQLIGRSFVLQVFDEGQQRSFTSVEGDEIEVIENTRLVHRAKLGVAVPAAQHGDDRRLGLFDGLRDSKCAVHVSWKGRGDEYQGGLMLRQCLECQCVKGRIYQGARLVECSVQVIESRLTGRQRFRVADEFEARVDRIANDVGKVVEIQGRDVLGTILQSQRAKGPAERVAMFAIDVLIERREALAFG